MRAVLALTLAICARYVRIPIVNINYVEKKQAKKLTTHFLPCVVVYCPLTAVMPVLMKSCCMCEKLN